MRKTGWIVLASACLVGAFALISTRIAADAVHPGAAADAGGSAIEATGSARDERDSAHLTEARADAGDPRTRAVPSLPAAAPVRGEGDGDETIGPERECDVAGAETGGGSGGARIAGAIRGILLCESGAWTADTLPKPNTVMLDLVALNAAREDRRGVLVTRANASGALELAFAFEDLPEGEYELTLSALGSWRWSPETLRVRPPLEGVTFTRYDKDARLPIGFEVFDAQLGQPIASFQSRHIRITPSRENGVFLHTGPLEADAFPLDARFTWSLWADGFAPAFGDETAFVRRGDRRIAHVELARGWSTRVLVLARDPAARQVQGAEILVDGRRAGFTGVDGTAVVSAAARPAALDVRHAGWKCGANPLEPYEGRTAEQRGQVTIVLLERE